MGRLFSTGRQSALKQVLFDRSGTVHVDDVPAPRVSAGRVLIRVAHSVISTGTETAEYNAGSVASQVAGNPQLTRKVWSRVKDVGLRQAAYQVQERLNERTPRGYSGSGYVIAVGEGVDDLSPGDRVSYGGEPHAEVVCAKRQLVARVPDGAPLDQAAITTLASIALHGLRLAEVSVGETVVVIGLGLVGQLTVALARTMGLRIAGADLIPSRVDLAAPLGMQLALNAGDPLDAARMLDDWTDGVGADAVLVCAASESSIPTRLALDLARDRGKVIVVGSSGLELERAPLFNKELLFRVSRSYGPGRYDPKYEDQGHDYPIAFVRWTENRNFSAFLSLLDSGAIDVSSLIQTRFPFAAAIDAYAAVKAGRDAPLTAILDYGVSHADLEPEPGRHIPLRASETAAKQSIRVGLIGCGGFTRSQIIPALNQQSGVSIYAIGAATGVSAANVGRLVKAAYCTTDWEDLIEDPEVDAIVIATRHGLHYPMALAAAKAGKPFHVEKPLAIESHHAQEIAEAALIARIPASIGFNRRSAPFVSILKQWLVNRVGPADVLIRVNANPLPADHWTLDPQEGGGRLVGEGCHFLDLAAYLVGDPGSVVAAATTRGDGTLDIEGNLSVIMQFADGSRATVCYGSCGNSGLPKERIEVAWDGKSVVIDDFIRMECHGIGKSQKLRAQDKGIVLHFTNFISALRGTADLVAPITAGVDVAMRIKETRRCVESISGAARHGDAPTEG